MPRGRPDQSAARVPLHLSRHVEPLQRNAEQSRKLASNLCLADAGRAGEEIVADRLVGITQAGTAQLDRGTQHLDRLVLTEDDRSEEHTSELQSLMRISYAVFCLKKKKTIKEHKQHQYT